MSKKADPTTGLRPNDIVQVIHPANGWYPCLIVVEEVEHWGVKGYTDVPRQGRAYIRMEFENITKVGHTAKTLDPSAVVDEGPEDEAI